MASITFFCPGCSELIAFEAAHAGEQAIVNCGQNFIIPSRDYDTPEKVNIPEKRLDPLPGFYRAALVDNWKVFVASENLTAIVFICACVVFKFVFGRAMCCINYVVAFFVWGWLLGFYLSTIYETAFDSDELPKLFLGDSFTWLWHVIKPFLLFAFTLFVVLLPWIIGFGILRNKGWTRDEIIHSWHGAALLMQMLLYGGLFFFPMAILITAVGQDTTMLIKPSCLVTPIFRSFMPYLTVVLLLAVTRFLMTQTDSYDFEPWPEALPNLAVNLAVQVMAIITMRAIGLFYRHYNCNLPY